MHCICRLGRYVQHYLHDTLCTLAAYPGLPTRWFPSPERKSPRVRSHVSTGSAIPACGFLRVKLPARLKLWRAAMVVMVCTSIRSSSNVWLVPLVSLVHLLLSYVGIIGIDISILPYHLSSEKSYVHAHTPSVPRNFFLLVIHSYAPL